MSEKKSGVTSKQTLQTLQTLQTGRIEIPTKMELTPNREHLSLPLVILS
ncbi:MAG: hypothetical protein F6K58_17520 [Symploca sp. SIO2E9]|nr:hypothetical protein [Symploca sp. SIO2E9]